MAVPRCRPESPPCRSSRSPTACQRADDVQNGVARFQAIQQRGGLADGLHGDGHRPRHGVGRFDGERMRSPFMQAEDEKLPRFLLARNYAAPQSQTGLSVEATLRASTILYMRLRLRFARAFVNSLEARLENRTHRRIGSPRPGRTDDRPPRLWLPGEGGLVMPVTLSQGKW